MESDEEGTDPKEQEALSADVEAPVDSSDDEDGDGDGEGEDEDEVSGGDSEVSSDDDTAVPGTIATYIGNASAPPGYRIVTVCAKLETAEDLQNFIGKTLLVGHDSKQACGWFIGLVHSTALSGVDKKKTPTANVIIKYDRARTGKKLHGLEAREISARLHGVDGWWVEIEKVRSCHWTAWRRIRRRTCGEPSPAKRA